MIDKMELKELLPNWYDGIYETRVLMAIEDDLLEELRLRIQKVQDNQYISTADSQTLTLYEQMLNITLQAGDTLEIRRFRILTRLVSKKPYTLRYFEEMFWALGTAAVFDLDYNTYTLRIETDFEVYGVIAELEYLYRSMVPANIMIDAYNKLTAEPPQAQTYLAAGIVMTETVEITHDFVASADITANQRGGIGMVWAETAEITHDFNVSAEITADQRGGSGIVWAESIEIK